MKNFFRYHKSDKSHGAYGGFTTSDIFMKEVRTLGYRIKQLRGMNWNLFETNCSEEICREILNKLRG